MPDTMEIHEFFVEGNNQERSHVLLHITEPGTQEERAKGYFFAVAEINNGPIEQIEHLQQMIDDLETGYYETEDHHDKNSFETALEYINRRGHHILRYKNSIVNCVVGILRGHDLYLACHGSPQAILFYTGKEGLEQYIISDETGADRADGQLFPSILQGKINNGDYFYAATPHVADYFMLDRVAKILSTRNTRQSADHMQKVLNDLGSALSFGGILLHFPTLAEAAKLDRNQRQGGQGSVASIDKLVNQEQATQEIMAPPLFGNLKKRLRAYLSVRKQKMQSKKLEKKQKQRRTELTKNQKGHIETNFRPREPGKEPIANAVLVSVGKAIVWGIINLFRIAKKTFVFASRTTVALILIISNKDNKRQDVLLAWRRWWTERRERFEALPLLSRVLFALTVLLALVFIGSIVVFKAKNATRARKNAYNSAVHAIIDKKTAAEASVMYGDDKRAFTLLQEAKTALATLPERDKKQKNKRAELANEIEEVLVKLRKLNIVAPEVVIDLSALNPSAKAVHLAQIEDTLLAFGPEDEAIYKINLKNKNAEMRERVGFGRLTSVSTPKENDFVAFAVGDSGIATYNKDMGILTKKDIMYPNENVKLSSIFIYNRKLYVIDAGNNQIYKHAPTQTGYDKGSPWLKDSALDVRDGVSLAVDGDVFVLKQNGELLKLGSGVKQGFEIMGLDPQLDKPTMVWTYNNVENIYILEPTNKRVVVLDKSGKLVAQYTANEWKKPTGMVVDEAKKTVFVLDENKIYKFNF